MFSSGRLTVLPWISSVRTCTSLCFLCQVGHMRRSAARRRELHILFMVGTTVVCYLLCWMPYGVVAMMATFGRPGLINPVASVVPSILAKSSTVINPVIYILMNKQVSSSRQTLKDPQISLIHKLFLMSCSERLFSW